MSGLDILTTARAWAAAETDQQSADELNALIRAAEGGEPAAMDELHSAFNGPLEFGTAGLRGKLGAGQSRMNITTVSRAAWGVGQWVKAHGGSRIVIGYDARRQSREFAHISAAILAGLGIEALVSEDTCPTPVLAYATLKLQADAGIMVTASHNPREDNGYKVYGGDGRQIVSPTDKEISALIEQAPATYEHGSWQHIGADMIEAYLADTQSLVSLGDDSSLRVAYTPLHGVGGKVAMAMLRGIGVAGAWMVTNQAAEDGSFPTCPKPNPEEDGVLTGLETLARTHVCDVAIANDPDADRCAVIVRHGGRYISLTGDDLGALLGAHMIARGTAGTFANSIVSGTLLQRICESSGVRHERTLTGFKWITRAADLAYGYEEALGYAVAPALVADKDGISAAALVCEMADEAKRDGLSLLDRLHQLWDEHGVHLNGQVAVAMSPAEGLNAVAALLANAPASIGGIEVESIHDMADDEPGTPGARIQLVGGGRILVRPSGTEPKIKCYVQAVVPVTGHTHERVALAEKQARDELARMSEGIRLIFNQH